MSENGNGKENIVLTFPDGKKSNHPYNITPAEILQQIGPPLSKKSVAAKFNNTLIDLSTPVAENGNIEFVNLDSDEGKEIYRHSTSHLMVHAVKKLFPNAKIAIGPSIKDGFYYDIDLDTSFTIEDLGDIENEMQKIGAEDLKIERKELKREEAIKFFSSQGEDYKVELIKDLDGDVSVYSQGDFTDLCRGPHLPSTGLIKNFKLLSIAGAYWRGDERNKMLQRIYGTAFPKKSELEDHFKYLDEVKKRDHRKLGKQLDLFSFHEEGPGFAFWHSKGLVIYDEMINYLRSVLKREAYQEVKTPIILGEELWHRSGHWDNYKNNMYFTNIEDKHYAVKPMNCPGGLLIFNEKRYSYKDFPLRVSELGLVHRYEKSGVLHGLFRVRQFIQDDAHIFCLPNQVEDEVINLIDLVTEIYSTFGFKDYKIELSTRPQKSIGSKEMWEIAEKHLENSLLKKKIDYQVNKGEGAFYGPKIDFHIQDSVGREWQCGTIQVDFSMPERFELEYINEDGKKDRPVMLHRAIYGSLERFIGIIIEEFAGDFPVWLAPVQVKIIPISEKFHGYADKI
ncbi:threonine--tRNA ligase, partial [candidate division KSB1 bacterium]